MSKAVRRAKAFFFLLKQSAINFHENEVIKYCASLSYYTIFSIAPMLIIAIAIGSVLFGKDAVQGHLFGQINTVVGTDAAILIQEMLKHATLRRDNFAASAVAVVIFIIGVTGVFGEIQSTINRIWGLKAKPEKGILRYLVSRVLSFAMVISVGFLMVVSMMTGVLIDLLADKLDNILPQTGFIVVVFHNVSSLLIIGFLFAIIFKFLPDSIVRWSDAIVGSVFTSVLFSLGKYLISLYMSNSPAVGVYGAAGSIIIILLWIYYSSVLLYFGAEFTRIYALTHGHGIRPNKFSVSIEHRVREIE